MMLEDYDFVLVGRHGLVVLCVVLVKGLTFVGY